MRLIICDSRIFQSVSCDAIHYPVTDKLVSQISRSSHLSLDAQITDEWLNTYFQISWMELVSFHRSVFLGIADISKPSFQSGSSVDSAGAITAPLSPGARTSAALYKWILLSNGFWSSEIKEDISLCPSRLVEVWCGDQIVVIRLSSETFQSKTTGSGLQNTSAFLC